MRRQRIMVILLACAIGGCVPFHRSMPREEETTVPAEPPDLSWFRDARFGLFIHWGPVSQVGTEISWSRCSPLHLAASIPTELYDNLYRYFNPTQFDADAFVAAARSAGMKYLVFTTKHHDGFCMFDSAWTDYKITNTPFHRDITAEIADACHRAGLKLGFYYSPVDWHHPDFLTENNERYITYMHRQLRELCTKYGRVDIIWFDGLGTPADKLDSPRLLEMIRGLQLGVLINNRAGVPADFDTPEQRVGEFQTDRPWESCITIGTQWSFKPGDAPKSLDQIIRDLAQCADGDGNLLLNVGPKWTGQIEPSQVKRLEEVGQWLKRYGESIYATRGGPTFAYPWGGTTHRGGRIYLHIDDWDEPRLSLPPLGRTIRACTALSGGTAKVISEGSGTIIELPAAPRPAVTVIALDLDGPTDSIAPIGPVTFKKSATASNVFKEDKQFTADKALDGSVDSRWATDPTTHEAWLEVDLGKEQTFDSVWISESFERVRAFQLEIRKDGEWQPFFHGSRIGKRLLATFEPVTAPKVRLHITAAADGPSINEFQLYPSFGGK